MEKNIIYKILLLILIIIIFFISMASVQNKEYYDKTMSESKTTIDSLRNELKLSEGWCKHLDSLNFDFRLELENVNNNLSDYRMVITEINYNKKIIHLNVIRKYGLKDVVESKLSLSVDEIELFYNIGDTFYIK